MRMAFLWPEMSGPADAWFRATSALGHDMYLAYRGASGSAPYRESGFARYDATYRYDDEAEESRLIEDLDRFQPDVIVAVSWHRPAFRKVLRAWEGRAVRVLVMDNPWLGTPKQWLGRLTSRMYVRPLFDAAFVPGERQAVFASLLGFDDDEIWRGVYVIDTSAFDHGPRSNAPTHPYFLLSARLAVEKGIEDLAEAWRLCVRDGMVGDWGLAVTGSGPLCNALANLPRVTMHGFVQPADLPAIYHRAGALVLPSRFEPWGFVIQEGCAAGLPIIATTAVGASPHLVRDGCNGWLVPPRRPDILAGRMADVAAMNESAWLRMSENSRALSSTYTPEGWARYLVSQCYRTATAMRP